MELTQEELGLTLNALVLYRSRLQELRAAAGTAAGRQRITDKVEIVVALITKLRDQELERRRMVDETPLKDMADAEAYIEDVAARTDLPEGHWASTRLQNFVDLLAKQARGQV